MSPSKFLSRQQWDELEDLPVHEQIVAVHGMCLLLGEDRKYKFAATPEYVAWIRRNNNAVTTYNKDLERSRP